MSYTVNLDEPLLGQQAVRELLNLSPEQTSLKVSTEDLIKIAVRLIKTELTNCNCDEDELLGLRVEYTMPHPIDGQKLGETYALEWKSLSHLEVSQIENAETELHEELPEAESNQVPSLNLPISSEFLARTAQRLSEMLVTAWGENVRKSSISWQFRREPLPGEYPTCTGECGTRASIYFNGKWTGKCDEDSTQCGHQQDHGLSS